VVQGLDQLRISVKLVHPLGYLSGMVNGQIRIYGQVEYHLKDIVKEYIFNMTRGIRSLPRSGGQMSNNQYLIISLPLLRYIRFTTVYYLVTDELILSQHKLKE
jgi:hypothetical protein